MSLEIISIISAVVKAIGAIPKKFKDRTKSDEEALIALSKAYHSTVKYYAFLENHSRDKGKEVDIAFKWERVGILLQKYDATLAERLKAKSRYWRDGATWSDEIIREAGIGLEHIRREVTIRVKPKK